MNPSPHSAATLEESYHKSDYDELTRLDARNLIDALTASSKQNRGENETGYTTTSYPIMMRATAEDKLHSKVTAQANSPFVSADAFGQCEAPRVRAPNAARPIVPWESYPSFGGSSVRKTSE